MAAKTIAVVNMKGGVGKTTVSVALAETFASVFGMRTLVIDLDAQASCSFALLGESGFEGMRAEGRHSAAFFAAMLESQGGGAGASTIKGAIETSVAGDLSDPGRFLTACASRLAPSPPLSLMGSVPALQGLEREIIFNLATAGRPRAAVEEDTAAHLARGLAAFGKDADVVLIDCPPGVSAFTEAAIRTADLIIAPVTPDYLPALGLEAFLFQTIQPLRRAGAFRGALHVLFNQVEAQEHQNRFVEQIVGVSRDLGGDMRVFETRVPRSRDMARAVEPPELSVTFEQKYLSASPVLRELAQEALDALLPADAFV